MALVNRLARTDVAPPSALNPAVPAVFDSIVLAMLQHDPADRPQTAAELQRRIASAVPGAANRDPSELGAIAVEVRDKHAARRAIAEPASLDTHESFSPAPRLLRAGSTGYRIGGAATPAPSVRDPVVAAPTLPPRWTGRRVKLGIAALLVVVVTVGILLVEHGGGSEASASVARAHRQVEVEMPVGTPTPNDRPAGAVMPPPTVPSPPPTMPPPPSTTEALPPPPIMPPSPAQPARRASGRALLNPRPSRRARSEVEAKPVPDPQARGAPSGKSPFSTVPFDDAGNQRAAHIEPNPVNVKKTPIVPEFDH
jgi:hypothetical protein